MSNTGAAHSAVVADRADRILEVLRHRDPSEADAQACSMLIAGLRMLDEVRGPDAVAAFLGQAGPIMAGHYPGGPLGAPPADPVPGPAAVTPPEPSHADMVAHDLAYLRGLPPGVAMGRANAAMEAACTFLHQALEQLGTETGAAEANAETAMSPAAPAPQPAPAATATRRPNPDEMALALLDGLRALPVEQGHEQARAAIWGGVAYLIEQRGPIYTAAVTERLQTNARRHIELWGMSPRTEGVPLH